MTPFQKQEQIKQQILGSYSNVVPATPIKKSVEAAPVADVELGKEADTVKENEAAL